MREILFRGKITDNEEWVEGLPSYDMSGNLEEIEVYRGFCDCDTFEVEPETVCQYTGLADKNGKKIFEGDIMKFSAYGQDYIGVVNIVSGNTCILCSDKKTSPFLDHAIEKYGARCIGNIFGNPELIGE